VQVPVGYGTDLKTAENALLVAAKKVGAVLDAPEPSVRLRQLGPADVLMELRFWTDSRRADLLATKSSVRRAAVETFREAAIPLPEPDLRRLRFEDEEAQSAWPRRVVERRKS
jgi:small conductance mechanosensitive channel